MHLPDPGQGFLNVNVLKQGHARVRKVDETTGEPLAGAVFRFTTDDGEKKEITTNAEGIAEWRDLIHDTKVTIEEITAPNGYVINRTPQTITICANETTTAKRLMMKKQSRFYKKSRGSEQKRQEQALLKP